MKSFPQRTISRDSVERVLRADGCSAMRLAGINEVALIEAVPPYDGGPQDRNHDLAIICHAGTTTVRVNRRDIEISAGTVLFVRNGNETSLADSGRAFQACIVAFAAFPAAWNHNAFFQVQIHAQSLATLLASVFNEHFGDGDTAVVANILEIIINKLRRALNPHQNHSRLQPVWDKVSQEPARAWDNTTMARIISVSDEHLRRLCQSELGCAPMHRVRWIRVQEASRRLRSGNDTIAFVAEQVGYQSERAFRVTFESLLGCSPGSYRRQERALAAGQRSFPLPVPPRPAKPDFYSATRVQNPTWTSISLAGLVNGRFSIGKNPWFGDLPLRTLRSGKQICHGAKFEILPETKGNSVILFRSGRVATDDLDRPLPSQLAIPVKKRASKIYILHAAGWVEQPGPFASYEFELLDGQIFRKEINGLACNHPDEPDGRQANIQDWYFAYQQIIRPDARHLNVTPASRPGDMAQYLYTLEWSNPDPAQAVREIRVHADSASSSTLAILAVSALNLSAKH